MLPTGAPDAGAAGRALRSLPLIVIPPFSDRRDEGQEAWSSRQAVIRARRPGRVGTGAAGGTSISGFAWRRPIPLRLHRRHRRRPRSQIPRSGWAARSLALAFLPRPAALRQPVTTGRLPRTIAATKELDAAQRQRPSGRGRDTRTCPKHIRSQIGAPERNGPALPARARLGLAGRPPLIAFYPCQGDEGGAAGRTNARAPANQPGSNGRPQRMPPATTKRVEPRRALPRAGRSQPMGRPPGLTHQPRCRSTSQPLPALPLRRPLRALVMPHPVPCRRHRRPPVAGISLPYT